MNVIKRNGQEVVFDKKKIVNAISKAFEELNYPKNVYFEIAKNISEYVSNLKVDYLTVETIQDIVEHKLMETSYKNVAKAYITYRHLHKLARDKYQELMKAVAIKLQAQDVKNQNANVDEYSFGGRIGEASSVITKKYALDYIVSPMARANHENNEIYIHDLDSYCVGSHNCLSIPFDDLLANGFNTRQTDIRPAQSVNTAFQLMAVIFQLQSLQQFGGVSATHVDWTLVPYVRKSFWKHYQDGIEYCESCRIKDILPSVETVGIECELYKEHYPKAYKYAIEMTEKEVNQAVEGMYHNLNTLQSRSGNQLPFTSINYGTCTLPEGRMITKSLLETSIKGIGRLHKTSIFPCGIFQCMKGVNRKKGDPNYDLFKLALRSTSQRLYPNYANVDWSGNAGYEINDPKTYFSTMGKRKLSSCKILMNLA